MSEKHWLWERDGISQSMIQTWMTCPMKASYRYHEGLVPHAVHNMPLEFGTLVHGVLDECYSRQTTNFTVAMDRLREEWIGRSGIRSADDMQLVEDTVTLASTVLTMYFRKWAATDAGVEWVHTEHEFEVPFTLHIPGSTKPWCDALGHPITVVRRGKFDGVFKSNGGLWLLETKTKGQIHSEHLVDALSFDLQTMFYLTAMTFVTGEIPKGVLYNILRRPQLRQGNKESKESFQARLVCDMDDRPDFYFQRYEVAVLPSEIRAWEKELNIILRSMRAWSQGRCCYRNTTACDKYGTCSYMPICARNDRSGFTVAEACFPELKGGE